LFKKISEIFVGHLPGEISYIDVHCSKKLKLKKQTLTIS